MREIEQELRHEIKTEIRTSLMPETRNIKELSMQKKLTDSGENVTIDKDDSVTKAFEVRES